MAYDKTGFKKAGIGNTWNYKEEGKGSEFKGNYLYKEENVGENNSTMYTFEVNDDLMSVWGTTLLDTRLKNVKPGEEVIIVYLGEEDSQKRKGKTYHNFEVYHREQPFVKVEDKPLSEITEEDVTG